MPSPVFLPVPLHGGHFRRQASKRTAVGQAPFKDDLAPSDIATACTFNTMFFTMSMMDYSADVWASQSDTRLAFLVEYVKWKSEMPVFGRMLLTLLPMLPLVLLGMFASVLQSLLGRRRARMGRHVIDCIELCTISSMFYTIATSVAPKTDAFMRACTGGESQKEACSSALELLTGAHLVLVFFQVIMFVAPIVKYRFNVDHDKAN